MSETAVRYTVEIGENLDLPEKYPLSPLEREYDTESLYRAIALVEEVFKDFISYEPHAPDEAIIIEMDWYTITKKDVKLGRSNLTPGSQIRHTISTVKFAKVFFDVLDMRDLQYSKDAGKDEKAVDLIAYLIAFDVKYKLGHSRFLGPWRAKGLI